MKILALDLGIKTGWAVWEDGRFTHGLQDNSHEFKAWRFGKFRDFLNVKLDELAQGDTVVFEQVYKHVSTYNAHAYGGFLAILMLMCADRQLPLVPVNVRSVKKVITGNGRAPKDQMCKAASHLTGKKIPTKQHDEADAICFAEFVRRGS